MGLSPWTFAGLVLGTLVYFAIFWQGYRRADSFILLAAMGQATVLLISIGIAAAAPWVEEAFSTKTILTSVARLPEYESCAVTLPLGDEYSADFYQEAFLNRALERNPHPGLKVLLARLEHPNRQVFVFRRRDWEELEQGIRRNASSHCPDGSLGRLRRQPSRATGPRSGRPAAITGGRTGRHLCRGSRQQFRSCTRGTAGAALRAFNPGGVEVASCAHVEGVAPFIRFRCLFASAGTGSRFVRQVPS